MSELKTKPTHESVHAFINAIDDTKRRKDCHEVLELMQNITGAEPQMWGTSIIGFGQYHYKYKSGREGDWFLTGFSPRKQNLTFYIMNGADRYEELLEKLGPHKTGKACLYVKRLADLDKKVLHDLIESSVHHLRQKYDHS